MCTRRFLGVVERDCENPNSGVVQVVKGDSSNAWELFAHLPLIRTHLGKGLSSNVTLKEMYLGNRRLLGTLKGADVEHFMQLLLQDRNPQYIDFLLSICICDDEPLPSNQELVCEQLLNLNAHLLPTCQVEAARESGELRLGVHLPGAKDQHGRDFWIDVCKFTETREWRAGEGVRDLASQIMVTAFGELNDQQKLFRYFVRCTNLFSKLALGRNQKALSLLLRNPNLQGLVSYNNILDVMKSDNVPALVRARFVTMMVLLFIPTTLSPLSVCVTVRLCAWIRVRTCKHTLDRCSHTHTCIRWLGARPTCKHARTHTYSCTCISIATPRRRGPKFCTPAPGPRSRQSRPTLQHSRRRLPRPNCRCAQQAFRISRISCWICCRGSAGQRTLRANERRWITRHSVSWSSCSRSSSSAT